MTTSAAADAGQVADRVEGDLGVVGSRPARRGRRRCVAASSSSPGKGGIGRAAAAGGSRSPKRSSPSRSNTSAPNPKVTVRRAGSSPTVSPVSSGGATGVVVDVADQLPGGHLAPRRRTMRAAARAASSGRSVTRSKAAKWSRSCAGVAIPAWWAPWKGTVPVPSPRLGGSRARPRSRLPPSADPALRQPAAPARRGAAAGGSAVRLTWTICAATCESGSASASIDLGQPAGVGLGQLV